jgi:hypothetical protein
MGMGRSLIPINHLASLLCRFLCERQKSCQYGNPPSQFPWSQVLHRAGEYHRFDHWPSTRSEHRLRALEPEGDIEEGFARGLF